METTVLYIGWATVIGALLFACCWVWYYALFWLFNAIKNTAAMGKFIRMHAISIRRKRARESRRYAQEALLRTSQKVGAGKTDKGYCAESTRLCECRRNGELSKHCQYVQAAAGWPTQVPTEIKPGAEMKVGELTKEHQE